MSSSLFQHRQGVNGAGAIITRVVRERNIARLGAITNPNQLVIHLTAAQLNALTAGAPAALDILVPKAHEGIFVLSASCRPVTGIGVAAGGMTLNIAYKTAPGVLVTIPMTAASVTNAELVTTNNTGSIPDVGVFNIAGKAITLTKTAGVGGSVTGTGGFILQLNYIVINAGY